MATDLDEQISATRAALFQAMETRVKLLKQGLQGYTIDSGQDRQTGQRLNLTELNKVIQSLQVQLQDLQLLKNGDSGVINGGAAW